MRNGEIDRLCTALSEGGAELMPLADYGFSAKFAWVNDRFGVSAVQPKRNLVEVVLITA